MDFINNIITLVTILGWVIVAFQFFYYRKIKFYIMVNKIFSTKKDANFELSFAFDTEASIQKISQSFQQVLENERRNIGRTNNKITFQQDSLIIQISKFEDSRDEGDFQYEILISNANSSLKTARKNLSKTAKVIEKLIDDEKINKKQITFTTKFPKENPFINPSVSRIGIDNVKHFIMIMNTSTLVNTQAEEVSDIQIGLKNLSYVDTSMINIVRVGELLLMI